MSKREYPYYAGREKYRGKPKRCECCEAPATHKVIVQTSWFRADDGEYLVCEPHAMLARSDYGAFGDLVAERELYMRATVEAQHEETGRTWSGERRNLPPRYFVIPKSET